MRRLRYLLMFLFVGSTLVIPTHLATPQDVRGDLRREDVAQIKDPWRYAEPDTVVTLEPGQQRVMAGTRTTSYGSTECGRFVVDVEVSSASKPPPGAYVGVSPFGEQADEAQTLPALKAECANRQVEVSFYHRPQRSRTFEYIGGGRITYYWNEVGGCLTKNSAYAKSVAPRSLPASGIEIYRIAVPAKVAGVLHPVRAGVGHDLVPT